MCVCTRPLAARIKLGRERAEDWATARVWLSLCYYVSVQNSIELGNSTFKSGFLGRCEGAFAKVKVQSVF